VVGILPGAGATIASFISYGIEKRLSPTPEKFGKGALQGVAGPESANNAASSAAFVPLLSLGIPGSATTAVLLSAFVILGIQPGPQLFTSNPDVVWGLIASMYIGNVMLLFQNTVMIPMFVWLLAATKRYLPVGVAALCFIGVYSVNNSLADVWIMLAFAVIGMAFKSTGIPAPPLVIAIVLGQEAEVALRQALVISAGSPMTLIEKPISATLLACSLAVVVGPKIYAVVSARKRGT
jgi:putative tricarboxylic transport membrane protein